MQKTRVTVTVHPETLAAAEQHVARGRARSVSAWVDAAMQDKARADDLVTLLAQMRAQSGPPSAEEEAWARRVLGL
ncbi:MAG: hypothetical protein HY744_27805 [Deltaproteobacteria bacterium]|nr:hypothetical protein [Deltaproteobacteria bacterium]